MESELAANRPVVLVGIDGSVPSLEALHWAGDYAQAFGGRLVALIAWQLPVEASALIEVPGVEFIEGDASIKINEALKIAKNCHPDVPVESRVVNGSAADALIEASKKADLLVVGSRGHGGFVGMLLGSVSAHCIHHANCPVVVLRHRQEP